MIELKHIHKAFGKNVLFQDFSMKIPDGSFTMITGESGCGKTTLLDMLGYLEEPDSGEILINGRNLKSIKQRIYFRDEVGFLFQNFALMERKTVQQNLNIIARSNRSKISDIEALERVGLLGKGNVKVYKLSGGEQQRVALARLMIKRCNLVLADEPTGSLDERNGRIVMEQLHRLKSEGKSIVTVTHNRQYLSEADYVVELK